MKVLTWIVVLVALIVAGPLLIIWSLNTLFPALQIGYGIAEWFAVVLLASAIRGNVSVKKE